MKPSALSHAEFLARFAPVYEASPWVAEGVWPAVEAGGLDDPAALAEALWAEVDGAPREMRLALIRAHPELAGRTRMAEASVKEQSGAGLDQCSADEFAASIPSPRFISVAEVLFAEKASTRGSN